MIGSPFSILSLTISFVSGLMRLTCDGEADSETLSGGEGDFVVAGNSLERDLRRMRGRYFVLGFGELAKLRRLVRLGVVGTERYWELGIGLWRLGSLERLPSQEPDTHDSVWDCLCPLGR